ncbi:MAG: Yip1 family protein [Gallionellaceae bacterium]
MNIVERAKNICLSPKTEWPVIAGETAATGSLITGYVLPLATIGAVAGFIGGSIIGHSIPFVGGTFRTPMIAGVGLALFQVVMSVVTVFILSFIINALAPSFGGEKNNAQAFKVAVYSYTPGWLAAIFHMIPGLGILAILGLYGLYVLYLGLPRLMKSPEDKALGYTVVVVICAIVLSLVIAAVGGIFAGAGMTGSNALLGSMHSETAAPEMQLDKNSPLGKLQEMGQKMEAAQKSGDVNAQAKASVAMVGTLMGGGKHVDPLSVEQIKSFIPDAFAGLAKKSMNAERSGMAGIMVSKAEASYGDNSGNKVSLELSDSGGMSGLVGLAGWAGVQGEKEDQDSIERTQNVDGRLTHERISKTGGENEFDVVIANRFVVSTKGNLDISKLKGAVSGIDLNRLEGLKDSGVQK